VGRFLEYVAFRFTLAAFQALAPETSLRLLGALSRAAWRFDGRHRRRTLDHLRMAFGEELSEEDAQALGRGVFDHIGRHVADFIRTPRRPDRKIRLVDPEILEEARAAGRGLVMVSAHLGFFTALGPALLRMGVPLAVILKRQHNARLLGWFRAWIFRWFGVLGVLKEEARERTPALLHSGHVVLFFADQHPIAGGTPARFFSRPVEAATGPALFAKRYRAPLVVVTTAELPDGTHEVRFQGPVSTEGTLREVSQRWLDLLQERIREHPDQWMWMHRRWREPARSARPIAPVKV
jgi:KDO2-lipid IV(A) lauroyltransferase